MGDRRIEALRTIAKNAEFGNHGTAIILLAEIVESIISGQQDIEGPEEPRPESGVHGNLLRDFIEPADPTVLTTFSVKMEPYLIYLGTDPMCRHLFEPQLKAVALAAKLTWAEHGRPVKILEASGFSPTYQSPNHPPGAHRCGKDMDDRYQLLGDNWHWDFHWNFWRLLKLFIPGIRVTVGKNVATILLVEVFGHSLPLWFSVDSQYNHDFNLEDCRSEKGVCHAHISGLDTPVNLSAEVPAL